MRLNLDRVASPKTVWALFFLVIASEIAALLVYLRIDNIVHGDLYHFGLQFEAFWAMQYWKSYEIVLASFETSTMVIGISMMSFHLYSWEKNVALRWACILLPLTSASLAAVSLFFIMQIDSIVNGTLYQYGLQFSLQWATTYWTIARSTLALIGAAIIMEFIMAVITWKITRD